MVTTKHCCWGDCKSDSRYLDDLQNLYFIGFGNANGFPKPSKDREKCLRWVNSCGRKYFTINNVSKDTYICSLHFVGGNGPTAENPDPVKCGQEVTRTSRKRKAPTSRPMYKTPKQQRTDKFDAAEALLLLPTPKSTTTKDESTSDGPVEVEKTTVTADQSEHTAEYSAPPFEAQFKDAAVMCTPEVKSTATQTETRLILVAVILFGFLSLAPSSSGPGSSRRSAGALYEQFKFDELPFQIIMAPAERAHPPPKQHVVFIKVHKSGSTTAQNIFLRFGWYNNLTFVLPPAKNAFNYPNIISLKGAMDKNNTLAPPAGRFHQILCNHVIYDRKVFRQYMPKDTFYVGILREPFEMFKSTLNYLRPGYIYNKIKTEVPASEYLKQPMKFEPKRPKLSFTNNRMAVEFGCPDDVVLTNNSKKIMQFVNELDNDFGLIIIAEYFEESIILLRRYMNWSTNDILYLDKNIAQKKNETLLVKPYDRHMYKKWARVDYAMYEHFFKRLRRQVREEGSDFDDELLHFREVRKMTSEFCKQKPFLDSTKLRVRKSIWSDGFEITKKDCILLQKQEMNFVQDIRFKQYGSRDI